MTQIDTYRYHPTGNAFWDFGMKGGEIVEQAATEISNAINAMHAREGKYLTFALEGEEYGLEILKVREIIGMMEITPVPHTPDYVKGVLNLRGKVIPVIDLRLRFDMSSQEYNERTCIIVVEIQGNGGGRIQMGIVVDSVSEVLNISGEDIEATPSFGVKLDTDYILGMAKTRGKVKILLDISKVLTDEDIVMIEEKANL